MDLRSTVSASADQVSCELGGEAVILNLKTGVYYGLNPLGARIWTLLEQPTRIGAIFDTIVSEYDVAADRCERELLAVLEDMRVAGLVEVDATAVL